MNQALNLAVTALALLAVFASVLLWVVWIIRARAGDVRPAAEANPPAPWGFVDLVLAFVIQSLTALAAGQWLRHTVGLDWQGSVEDLPVDQRAQLQLASAAATLISLLLTALWLYVRHQPNRGEWGIDYRRWSTDVVTGAAAFVMLAPVVYGVQFVAVQVVESKHPLLELLKANPSPRFFLVSGLAAVGVAPLAEEFFYRLLLQGWLTRLAQSPAATPRLMLLGGHSSESPSGPQPFWPVAVSSLLFALAHASHGPDPIPLFILALGLGFLYRRTQRIVPSIVVHALLNSCTLAMMWVAVQPES